ncbi:MAG: Rrf2 family transcriptional regulator, partial [Acidaminococcaceae bacterium]
MLDLAEKYNLGCVSIKELAKDEELSAKYLEHIISTLTKAGFVTSTRGAHGGYCLKKEPSNYTVGAILRLMEGDLALVYC